MALDYSNAPQSWAQTEWTEGTGSTTNFSQNGSTDENHRIYANNPWGRRSIVWECRPLGDGVSNGDGGFNHSEVAVDPTYLYRFSLWYNRTVYGVDTDWQGTSDGRMYMGAYGYDASSTRTGFKYGTSEVTNTNFYWIYSTAASHHEIGEWRLIVGHIYPHTHSITTNVMHPDSGVWRQNATKFRNIYYDCKFLSTCVSVRCRGYLFYCYNDSTARQQFFHPRLDKCDGTEPTLKDLLRDGRSYMIANLLIN